MKGRGNSSSITVGEATKLDLSYLIKKKFIQKGKEVNFHLTWTNGSQICCYSVYNENDIYVRLSYRVTDKLTNELKDYDYKVYIQKVKSNLGTGEVLYFVCPETALYCRKLFMCYGYYRFKHRLAYNNKIYYHSQTVSKESRNNTRYFKLEDKINKIYEQRESKIYKGKTTKKHLRLLKLINKKVEVDKLREIELDNYLRKMIGIW
jgi:hypothetical protein